MENKFSQRKPNRLKNYDYSQNGCYFITICTKDRKPILSKIITVGGDDPAPQNETVLKPYGKIVEEYINSIHSAYNTVYVENYIIMPNHIHLLVLIDTYGLPRLRLRQDPFVCSADISPCRGITSAPTIGNVISAFKHLTNKQVGFDLWQRSFYDHIIRNFDDYINTWNYIEYNALKEYGNSK